MPQMTAVQLRSPGAPFEASRERSRRPDPTRYASEYRPAGSVIATCLSRRAIGLACNIRASQGMRWPEWSTRLAQA